MSDCAVSLRSQVMIPLERWGESIFYSFKGFLTSAEHFAVQFGQSIAIPLVRLHSECITGDLFGSMRCDCGKQLEEALQRFANEGGILLYLKQEGRGIGLFAKLDAYRLQEAGLDTFEANARLNHPEDARDYECAAAMLKAMGIERIRLMTNNPDKARQLMQYGILVEEIIPTGVYSSLHNENYLRAKVRKGHQLNMPRTPQNAQEEAE